MSRHTLNKCYRSSEPEVWDPAGRADPRPHHHQDVGGQRDLLGQGGHGAGVGGEVPRGKGSQGGAAPVAEKMVQGALQRWRRHRYTREEMS